MDLIDVCGFLYSKQCLEGQQRGECPHPACQRARDARDIVAQAAELLEPARPSQPKLAS